MVSVTRKEDHNYCLIVNENDIDNADDDNDDGNDNNYDKGENNNDNDKKIYNDNTNCSGFDHAWAFPLQHGGRRRL